VCDLTNRMYFFELTTSPSIIWVEFDALDLSDGGDAKAIDPYDPSLTGNVTDRFTTQEIAF
jgi:choloylglycine hydrolase